MRALGSNFIEHVTQTLKKTYHDLKNSCDSLAAMKLFVTRVANGPAAGISPLRRCVEVEE
jgi:hypothetical protein